MGNCIARCFGIADRRRKYLRTRYSVERDFSIEFENLMEDDPVQDEVTRGQLELRTAPFTVSRYVRVVSLHGTLTNEP